MKAVLNLALILFTTGCACSIIGHKPCAYQSATVIQSSPNRVATEWPQRNWSWVGQGTLATGEYAANVCPETVPPVGSRFDHAYTVWDKSRKCWVWTPGKMPKRAK